MEAEVLPSPFKCDTLHWSICLTGTSPKEIIWLKGKMFYLVLDITATNSILLFPLKKDKKTKRKISMISVIAEMLIKLVKSEVSMKSRVCLSVLKTDSFCINESDLKRNLCT